MMNWYLDKAQLSLDSPLFCQLSKTKLIIKLELEVLVALG